jgi:hypothetical protein
MRFASVDSVSRDMVALLEPQYSAVAIALDHQMKRTIPVVILQDAEYRIVTGAPAWAGGSFDNEDGTITIPLGLLDRVEFTDPDTERGRPPSDTGEQVLFRLRTPSSRPEREHGPRDIHEGLAHTEREATKDRTGLSASGRGRQGEAARRYPNNTEAQQRFVTAMLGQLSRRSGPQSSRRTVRSTYGAESCSWNIWCDNEAWEACGSVEPWLKRETCSIRPRLRTLLHGTRRAWLDWLRAVGVGDVRNS